jgi:hypothetical protein
MSHDDLKVEELDADEFDDEELDQLLEEDQAPEEEEPLIQPEKERWHPSGPCFRGEIIDEEKLFCVDGKMVPEPQLQAAQEDPELYNFLLMKQKEPFEPDPDGLRIVGQDPRDPDQDELEGVIGRICPFCGQAIEVDEVTVSDMGSLVFYGSDVWHWEHLALMALLVCKGHYQQAAEKYHLPLEDLKCMRTIEMRSLNWGRLGYVRSGQ